MPTDRPKRSPPKPSATAYTSSCILKSSSPLTQPTTDLQAFLLTCLTSWTTYSSSQRQQIIASLPPPYRIHKTDSEGNLECPLSTDFVQSDPYLREGIEKFKRDVSEGYFDATWRKNAAVAMREKEEGKFDEYLREKVEAEFGEAVEEAGPAESSESDKEWGKGNARPGGRGNGKNTKGGKSKGRPRGVAARGELQSLPMEMDDD